MQSTMREHLASAYADRTCASCHFRGGDHRMRSTDSRNNSVGLVDTDDVVGRAWLRFWPLDTLGIVQTPDYPELEARASVATTADALTSVRDAFDYVLIDCPPNVGVLTFNALRAASEVIAAPRYSPEDLGKSMGRFIMDRARLLANGMQEFLFRLEP